jgi:hypothetical protein
MSVKKQTTVMAFGAVLVAIMTAPSFAATEHHAVYHTRPASTYSAYYNPAAIEGNDRSFQGIPTTSGYSGAIGGIGR